jgi:hypothetical protein
MAATDSINLNGSGNLNFPLSARRSLKPRPTQNKWSNRLVRKLKRSPASTTDFSLKSQKPNYEI